MATTTSTDLAQKEPQYTATYEEYAEHVTESAVVDGSETHDKYTFDTFMALLSLTLAYAGDSWNSPAVGALLTILNEDIGPSKAYVWMSTAYVLPQAIVAPMVGRLSDIFGRREFMLAGNGFCFVGSIIMATSKSVNMFIAGSALTGFGAGIHQISYASVSELVPRKSRPFYLALFQGCLAATASVSPIAGLLLAKNHSWTITFWIALCFYGPSFVLLFVYYRPAQGLIKTDGFSVWEHLRTIDWVGCFLLATGLCLFLVGLSFGGGLYPWKSAATLVPMVLGVVVVIIFAIWETFTTAQFPLLPKRIMKEVRFFLIPCAGAFMFGIVYYSSAILWPLQIQALYTTDPGRVGGLTAIPSICSGFFVIPIGYLFSRYGHGREWFIFVTIALTASAGAQAIVSPSSLTRSAIITGIMGPSFGACAVITNAMVHLGVPHDYIGIASSLAFTFRAIGGSIATVVYTTILTNELTKNLFPTVAKALGEAGVPATEIIPVATALITADTSSPLFATLSATALEAGVYAIKIAYSVSLRTVYLVSLAFGSLTIIAACFCGNFDSRMTSNVDVQVMKHSAHIHGDETIEMQKHVSEPE